MIGEKEYLMAKLLLDEKKPIPSKKLASKLNVSPRSIRNYVSNLNTINGGDVIVSTPKGYIGVKKRLLKIIEEVEMNQIPQNAEERISYIVKKILFNHEELNIYDLCIELYVSESTIKKDIVNMNKRYSIKDVEFFMDGEIIKVSGEEKDLRKLMSKFILDQSTSNYLELQKIQDNFPFINISKLYQLINDVFNSEKFYVNEYSKMNMILHIAIFIDRIKNNRNINREYLTEIDSLNEELVLTKRLIEKLQYLFEIKFNYYESLELLYVIKSNVNFLSNINKSTFDKRTEKGFFDYVFILLEDVFEDYGICLKNNYFLQPFLLHLSNLYIRVKNQKINSNSIFQNVKHENPLIFDIAVYISMKISNFLNVYPISEDEISYITLHVGSEINRQKNADSKIRTILVYPNYLNLSSRLYNKILYRFEKELDILDIVNSYGEVEKYNNIDLIITTIPFFPLKNIDYVVVSPLNEDLLFKTLYDKLDEIREKKNYHFLNTYVDEYISDQHFIENLSELNTDKYSVIEKMTDQLIQNSVTSEDFFNDVKQRELSSSTAFGQLAIPHSIKMDAFKTKIVVGVDKNGFKWDEHSEVKIVLLIAINKTDVETFRTLYEALVSLFDNSIVVDYLSNAKSGGDFKARMRNILAE